MSRNYHPRRAGKRWLEGAPEYILDCFDNKGKTADRYTVIFGGSLWDESMGRNTAFINMSGDPDSPQGVSMWGEGMMQDFRYRFKHRRCRWLDLPENVRAHALMRAQP